MREYGWRKIDPGEEDCDRYDHLESETVSVILHHNDGEVVAGVRLTFNETSVEGSLSAEMWSEADRSRILEDEQVERFIQRGVLVDTTRLLLGKTGKATDLIVLLGACVAATKRQFGTYFTMDAKAYSYLKFARLPIRLIHSGAINGSDTVFALIPPPREIQLSERAPIGLLMEGARMVSRDDALFSPAQSDTIDLRQEEAKSSFERTAPKKLGVPADGR